MVYRVLVLFHPEKQPLTLRVAGVVTGFGESHVPTPSQERMARPADFRYQCQPRSAQAGARSCLGLQIAGAQDRLNFRPIGAALYPPA